MTIRRLLTATAVLALFQAPAVFAQDEASGSGDALPEAKIVSGAAADTGPESSAASVSSAGAQTTGETSPDVSGTSAAAAETVADGEAAATDAAAAPQTAESAAAPAAPAVNPLIQAAASYAQYRRDLNFIRDVAIDSPAALDGVMDRLAAHRPAQLSNAFIGYSALLVAQQKDFVDQVRTVADYFGKEQVITGLLNDPAYVMTFQNSGEALQTALASADDEEADLLRLGDRFKQQSYSLQHEDWALQVVDRANRLALINAPAVPPAPRDYVAALAGTGAIASGQDPAENAARREALASVFEPLRMPATPSAGPAGAMTAAADAGAVQVAAADPAAGTVTDAAPIEGGAEAGAAAMGGADDDTMSTIAYDEDEARSTNAIMTLAALEALGAGETRPEAMKKVMSKVRTKSCLDWAHTQLQVCVAAGHFKYEDAFCIAEHQLNQVGQCLGAITAN